MPESTWWLSRRGGRAKRAERRGFWLNRVFKCPFIAEPAEMRLQDGAARISGGVCS